jgi:nicotinamidase-related amidase
LKIDAADVQILFAHLQRSLVSTSRTEDPQQIERSAAVLMEGSAMFGIPATFALVQDGQGTPQPVDALVPFASRENSFIRHAASPFLIEGLHARITRHGRGTLVVSGFSTDGAVLHSALDALDLGFRVLVPVDAVGCHSPRAEHAALRQIERAGGEQTSASAILSMLAPDFSEAPGTTMLRLIAKVAGQ